MNKKVKIHLVYLTHFSFDKTNYQIKTENSWLDFKPPIERILWAMMANLRK